MGAHPREQRRRHPAPDKGAAPVAFVLPPYSGAVVASLLLLVALAVAPRRSGYALLDPLFAVIPQRAFQFGLAALAVVHAVEAAAMFATCSYLRRRRGVRLDSVVLAQYTASTVVFGVFAAMALRGQLSRRRGSS
ncbi:hypothetical protein IWQ57_001986 [Coemansia nantahalensis]|uniref:Uncharacterized protein n=1 Tax=Coemansia nantahalensis TaxID=2789366 RepID=A0ACC1K2J2_9FUNG|nr:hypothetical protein IWQ57_001986 [Coemansia nantahalensis]